MYKFTIDIEVYDKKPKDNRSSKVFEQATYLVHGYDDVYWTDNFMEVGDIIRAELIRYENGEIPNAL